MSLLNSLWKCQFFFEVPLWVSLECEYHFGSAIGKLILEMLFWYPFWKCHCKTHNGNTAVKLFRNCHWWTQFGNADVKSILEVLLWNLSWKCCYNNLFWQCHYEINFENTDVNIIHSGAFSCNFFLALCQCSKNKITMLNCYFEKKNLCVINLRETSVCNKSYHISLSYILFCFAW